MLESIELILPLVVFLVVVPKVLYLEAEFFIFTYFGYNDWSKFLKCNYRVFLQSRHFLQFLGSITYID
jgi:hypothetical protein